MRFATGSLAAFSYNAVLALIVLAYFCIALPESRATLTVDGIFMLFLLAVLANLCY